MPECNKCILLSKKDRFRLGKMLPSSGSLPPCSLVGKKLVKAPKIRAKRKKPSVQFGSAPPVQSCRSTSMAPALKEDDVIGSNDCKNVISTSGLSVSRSFYNMAVSAVTRALVFKVHFICLCVS